MAYQSYRGYDKEMMDSWCPNLKALPYIPKNSNGVSLYFHQSVQTPTLVPVRYGGKRRISYSGSYKPIHRLSGGLLFCRGGGRRFFTRIFQGILLLVLILTIAVNVALIIDKTQRLAALGPAHVQGMFNDMEFNL